MFIAMICMAFTATVLTSCGSDDDEAKANKLVMVPSTYDPANQLTVSQKSSIDAIVKKAGTFSYGYNDEKETIGPAQSWMQGIANKIGVLIASDPTIMLADKAGIKIQISAEGKSETQYLTFGDLLDELK